MSLRNVFHWAALTTVIGLNLTAINIILPNEDDIEKMDFTFLAEHELAEKALQKKEENQDMGPEEEGELLDYIFSLPPEDVKIKAAELRGEAIVAERYDDYLMLGVFGLGAVSAAGFVNWTGKRHREPAPKV